MFDHFEFHPYHYATSHFDRSSSKFKMCCESIGLWLKRTRIRIPSVAYVLSLIWVDAVFASPRRCTVTPTVLVSFLAAKAFRISVQLPILAFTAPPLRLHPFAVQRRTFVGRTWLFHLQSMRPSAFVSCPTSSPPASHFLWFLTTHEPSCSCPAAGSGCRLEYESSHLDYQHISIDICAALYSRI